VRARATLAVALFAGLLALPGCGGSSDSGEPTQAKVSTAPRPYVAEADGICREMLRETRQLGRRFVKRAVEAGESNFLGAETEHIVKPGLVILRRTASRFRRLSAQSHDPSLAVYVGLYEPLIQLGELRLAAGRVDDLNEAKNLERQMEELGAEQRVAAQLAGLRSCEVDFLQALVSSWRSQ
jgi:hypothetical protein